MSTLRKDYTQFACMNCNCKLYNQQNQGNIAHHSWMGKNKNIQRLRCRECRNTFSENKYTLRERAKIDEYQQELILKCFRWGMPDEGTSDIAQVDLKTVRLFRSKVAAQAQAQHEVCVHGVDVSGVQMDELRAKQSGEITWAAVAMAMSSFLILAVACGRRNQRLADKLLAEVYTRCCNIKMILTDGWVCYLTAILKCFGRLYQPRRSIKKRGRKLSKRLKLDERRLFFAQVIKDTVGRFQLCAVRCRAVIGSISECLFFIRVYKLGSKIHTSHIERWFGSLRCCVASLRRKSRCVGEASGLSSRIWIYVCLHNWVICHATLCIGGQRRTPAMAAGLIDHPMSYRELIRLRVYPTGHVRAIAEAKFEEMESEEMVKACKRTKRPQPEEKVIWKRTSAEKEEAA